MEKPRSSLFALVTYVPEPLRSFVESLRASLPGETLAQPHLTLLPPRSMQAAITETSEWARQVLRSFSAFSVEVRSIYIFPQTNMLYLDAHSAGDLLFALHRELNSGLLFDEERYEFHPHLTLGGPILPEKMAAARDAAENAWTDYQFERTFRVDEVVALGGIEDGDEMHPTVTWTRLWTYSLSSSQWKAASAGGAVPHN